VPGYLIPEMYFEYLRTQDARPLVGIFYHNAIDILSLAGLFSHLAFLLQEPNTHIIQHSEDLVSLGRYFETAGDDSQAVLLYTRALAEELTNELRQDTRFRLSLILKRKGDWDAAQILWEQAARDRELYAFEELAKYFEHHAKDLQTAQFWASQGKIVLAGSRLSTEEHKQWQSNFDHRLKRLARKLSSI